MVRKALTRLDRIQQALAEKHLTHMLAYGAAVIAVALGVGLILAADSFRRTPSFQATFSLVQPEAWGLAYIVTGCLLAFGFWRDRVSGQLPAFVLTTLYCAFGISSSVTLISTGQGVPSAGIIYTGMAWFSLATVIAIGPRKET